MFPKQMSGPISLVLRLAGLAVLTGSPAPATAQVKVFLNRDQALSIAFAEGESFRPVTLGFDAHREREIEIEAKVRITPGVTDCFQARRGGEITAYVCIDNMVGRTKYVTYFVRINHPAGAIARIEMMQHRESVGTIIANPRFIRHFRGKTAEDWMFVGIDFPLITGSTLTERAMVNGARKVLHIYDMYLRHLPAEGSGQPVD